MKNTASSPAEKQFGLAPGTVVYTGDKTSGDLYIEVFDYSEDFFEEKELNSIEEAFKYSDSEPITWINVNGLNHTEAIEKIGEHYDLHPLILEDIANTDQRPKIDEYEKYLFVVLKMLYFDKDEKLCIEHISFVLGNTYVISFQESDGDVFDSIRNRIRLGKGRVRSMGSDYLLYALMDAAVDNYFNLIEAMGDKIEELEDNLFEEKPNDDITYDIQSLKREVLKIRRAVFPLREVVNRIEKSEHHLITEKTQFYLRDLYDHIIQVSENIEIYREMTWGLMDMYMTTISNKMNEVMKVLTIMASIFIPLTFLAGIYGMNFENIPELKFKYGYHILWGIMIAVFIGLLYYFKRKKWL
ncbi:magnesium/cobalt transporter CorA [Aquimarina muelleri]|uniref:Magnesium transport protein CorA n=1 Tax=Aquimarina muelleri TaxID=279356 RepID=A0A918N3N4_9FLAO|nr:magnesium/cobalt transporter CorA [Aquimarina muelleri]MCX2763003.1 magnesium/cobalt transporter CorA [Aquimarina muelleri]GGX15379.1 magnesium transport protein CorA [Aquimarina muelleri]